MKLRWKSFLFLFAIALSLSACQSNQQLDIGIEDGLKPLAFKEGDKLKGFEVDLWKAVAKEAGLKYKMKAMPVGEMVKAVRDKKLDAGLAGVTITKERKKDVEFSTAYYTAGLRMMTRKGTTDIKGPSDLEDKVVATRLGTTAYRYASHVKGIKEVRAVPEMDKVYRLLENGEVDAVLFDGPVIRYHMKQGGKDNMQIVGKTLTKEQYGIVLRMGSPYTGRINNALDELGKNGTYEKIYVKWFGEKPKAIPGG